MFFDLWHSCLVKRSTVRKGIVVTPIVSKTLNVGCHIDLNDMQVQHDGDFKFILNYQDDLTKYCILWLLTW